MFCGGTPNRLSMCPFSLRGICDALLATATVLTGVDDNDGGGDGDDDGDADAEGPFSLYCITQV